MWAAGASLLQDMHAPLQHPGISDTWRTAAELTVDGPPKKVLLSLPDRFLLSCSMRSDAVQVILVMPASLLPNALSAICLMCLSCTQDDAGPTHVYMVYHITTMVYHI